MYDINTSIIKKGKRFYYIFFFAGLLFAVIFGGICIANVIRKNSMDSQTMSTSVSISEHRDSDGDRMYSATYNYEVDGKAYQCSSNSSSSIKPSTDNQTVYYNSKNPSDCATDEAGTTLIILLIAVPLTSIFMIIGIIGIVKINKRVKRVEKLKQSGKLIKGLPCTMEESNMVVNGVHIMRPSVDYTLPSGEILHLSGDPRHDHAASETADLVIDESDTTNYFIDFEINRTGGSQPGDFFQKPDLKP